MERVHPVEAKEDRETLNHLHLRDLNAGDEIIIKTESGPGYKVRVVRSDGKVEVVFSVFSEVGLDNDIAEDQAREHTAELHGSCSGVVMRKEDYKQIPLGPEEGSIEVGKNAYLGDYESVGEGLSLVTMPITEISIKRCEIPEEKAEKLAAAIASGEYPSLEGLSQEEVAALAKRLISASTKIEAAIAELPSDVITEAALEHFQC